MDARNEATISPASFLVLLSPADNENLLLFSGHKNDAASVVVVVVVIVRFYLNERVGGD